MTVNESISPVTEFLEKALTTKTVIGEAQTIGNITLIPVMDVMFGFGGGGGEGIDKENKGSGNGGGAGVRMTPKAVLVIKDGEASVLPLGKGNAIDKILEAMPGLLEKMKIQLHKDDEKAEG